MTRQDLKTLLDRLGVLGLSARETGRPSLLELASARCPEVRSTPALWDTFGPFEADASRPASTRMAEPLKNQVKITPTKRSWPAITEIKLDWDAEKRRQMDDLQRQLEDYTVFILTVNALPPRYFTGWSWSLPDHDLTRPNPQPDTQPNSPKVSP